MSGGSACLGASGVLAVRGVDLARGGRRVLESADLVAVPGRMLALVGPNGAGKSTLLGVLAGLLRPDRGEATLDGRALAAWPPRALARRRAMLSQHVRLDFAFTAREVVLLGRIPHGGGDSDEDRRIVDDALRATQAWPLRSRRYLELSVGEQQRVQLARVLAQLGDAESPPRWLLLDEPEAGLDVAHQHFILEQARRCARQGHGVVAVLHDLNLAARYADDAALIAGGRVLRHGAPHDALDAALLSQVYGLPLRRIDTDDGWLLAAARA
ncbi:MAG TPA: heme ABC transporter ATP-binding protein [Dokdonella sp.]